MSKKIPDDCMPRCSGCAFYVAEKKDKIGECHRYPPVLVPEEGEVIDEDEGLVYFRGQVVKC